MLDGFEKVKFRSIFDDEEKYIKLYSKSIAFSRSLSCHVRDKYSLFENGNLLALIPDPNGDLKVHKSASGYKTINSSKLQREISKKFNCGTSCKLRAWIDDDAVVFTEYSTEE